MIFAAFILTHGRPERVVTYATLRRAGYTGRIVLIVDDEDTAVSDYIAKYPGEVEVFSKSEIAKEFDSADNFTDRRAIVYARNAAFKIAEDLGIEAFIQLDDDYGEFQYRWGDGEHYNRFATVKNLDRVFASAVQFLEKSPVLSVAFAQTGDYIGGAGSNIAHSVLRRRKAMNSFVCLTKRRFYFHGRINEDVNTYTHGGSKGQIFLTIPQIAIVQGSTQQHQGGMTELYKAGGTYLKSFYSVLFQPSSVRIGAMGDPHLRIHHKVKWGQTVPMILPESTRKKLVKA